MSERIINLRDLHFQLFEVLDSEALTGRARYAEHSIETFQSALDAAHRIAVDKFAPHNRHADEREPEIADGHVRIIPEVKQALDAYVDAGFLAAQHDAQLGGMQLPGTIASACHFMFAAANVGTNGYVMLTLANANVIARFGTEQQKARYLTGLRSGRSFGTMALTEPQAGSSLADIRTMALPQPDGSYRLHGNKIFISGGDHELSENIVHLVLAKTPGAPPGTRGISLFIVPKYRVADDGARGARNDVSLSGLLHKMGWRGTTSTMLSFGERGDCYAELLGQPYQGMATMFHMMNEARIGVGANAAMLGYRGYLAALDYAKERPQGRSHDTRDPSRPQIPIIEHADVRRMLLAQKAYVEGGFGLCLYAARLQDDQQSADSESVRADASLLLELLTPVVKSWPAQWCLEANSLAIQVLGGYGYMREYPVEQFYRDNRLNAIHEGTHGIQALDLLARKLQLQNGATLQKFVEHIEPTLTEAGAFESLRPCADALRASVKDTVATVAVLSAALREQAALAQANASVLLEAFGHVVVAWIWLRQAVVAARAKPLTADDKAFYDGKIQTCHWFSEWELPKTAAQFALLRSLNERTLSMKPEWF
ncbi:acyl-CoA dehydrogenase [Povalibacter sp.]|uniref:acyl-CoA dehydrogenase n=1 Tax=Povalibacter sp. TaxID=1962978 RepID=UPI002F42AD05